MDDGLESDRKRMAKLDARIIKLSAELDPTQRDAHFATLESKKASVPTRMVKHAARVDTLGAQLESELRANVKAGAEDSKHVISAITGLAPGDPTSIARTVEMSIPHIRGHHAFQASALAALFLRLVKAMDCEYSMADFVIFNTSAINRTRTFAEVAEKSAAGIVARFDTVLADNGREPKPTTPAYVAAAGPNAGSLDAASIVKRGEVAQR